MRRKAPPEIPGSTSGARLVAGVDEAGRGPLAGPVVVAAVILPEPNSIDGLDDSKRLPRQERERLAALIERQALCRAVVAVDVAEIDELNILAATLTGMRRAVEGLSRRPGLVMVDGNRAPEIGCEVHTVIGGDRWVPSISAASILAKVYRDALMLVYHERWPDYGFDRHKGYPTPEHLQRLRQHGPCPIHRRSFAPVRAVLEPSLF
ncbi:MAG: ribonuclease HII [Gammaproteobacteria bacterium]